MFKEFSKFISAQCWVIKVARFPYIAFYFCMSKLSHDITACVSMYNFALQETLIELIWFNYKLMYQLH